MDRFYQGRTENGLNVFTYRVVSFVNNKYIKNNTDSLVSEDKHPEIAHWFLSTFILKYEHVFYVPYLVSKTH